MFIHKSGISLRVWDCKDIVVRCAIWYHLYNLKNVKNIHGGVLILVKLQASACNFTKINTPPWAFFTFFKLCKSRNASRDTLKCLQDSYQKYDK